MPVTDDDLRRGAYRLSGAMAAMLRADGVDPDIIGIPDQQDADVFAESFQIDADWASIGTSFAKAVIDGIKSADPGKVAGWAVDQLLGQATAALEPKPVPGEEAIPVVDGYVSARDSLFKSYEDNLEQIRAWIQGRWVELHDDPTTIPEPLPASTDVDGPDFRYENFAYHDHVHPEDYAPEVERERQRYAAEKTKPGGVISQRLIGEG